MPASRIVHTLVSLNGRTLGLYYLKEGHDKGFLQEHFGHADGHIYQGDTSQDIHSHLEIGYGEDRMNTPQGQSDLKALVAALNEPDLDRRCHKVAQLLDTDCFMRYTAVAILLNTVDAYPLQANNIRIYPDPATKKFVFFPSGNDRVDFGGCSINRKFPPAAQKLIETKQGRGQYLAALEQILARAYQPEVLVKRADSLIAVLQPVVKEYEPQVANNWMINFWVRDAIPKRASDVAEQLRNERAR